MFNGKKRPKVPEPVGVIGGVLPVYDKREMERFLVAVLERKEKGKQQQEQSSTPQNQ